LACCLGLHAPIDDPVPLMMCDVVAQMTAITKRAEILVAAILGLMIQVRHR
jgi:hypothetical protein